MYIHTYIYIQAQDDAACFVPIYSETMSRIIVAFPDCARIKSFLNELCYKDYSIKFRLEIKRYLLLIYIYVCIEYVLCPFYFASLLICICNIYSHTYIHIYLLALLFSFMPVTYIYVYPYIFSHFFSLSCL